MSFFSVLFLVNQITFSMTLLKPKAKAKEPAVISAPVFVADSAVEIELRDIEKSSLLQGNAAASAPLMYEPLDEGFVVQETGYAMATAPVYPVLTAQNEKTHVEVRVVPLAQSEQVPSVHASLAAAQKPAVVAPLGDQKKSKEFIKHVISKTALDSFELLNARRRAEPLIREKVKKQYPNVPLFVVEEQLPSLFDADLLKSFLPHSDSIKLAKQGLFALEVYARCIPILNGTQELKAKIKTQYEHLTDKDVAAKAEEIIKSVVVEELVKISIKVHGSCQCIYHWEHKNRFPSYYSCAYYKSYEWILENWEKTKKLEDPAQRKILEDITEIECVSESDKSGDPIKSECSIQ